MTDERKQREDGDEAVPMPIDGVLDLHMFPPRDAKDLVRDYVDACRETGVLELRIVHGKGIGALRETVRAVLDRHPAVEWYGHPNDPGSWGVTAVLLRPPAAGDEE